MPQLVKKFRARLIELHKAPKADPGYWGYF